MTDKRSVGSETIERTLKWLTILAAIGFVALFAFSATLRLLYPYEVEWMEGSMIDHAIRVLHGLPIYTMPSVDFVAWLYPPSYYYVTAWLMHVTGEGFLAGRLVSVVATLTTCAIIATIVHRVTKEKLLSGFAAALYIAAYHATGYYYDIARNDALFVLSVLCMALIAVQGSRLGLYVSALLLVASFFTKQQAVFFGLALCLWYFARTKREGAAFTLGAFIAVIGSLIVANTLTHGWFSYYVFDIPSAKRADFSIFHALLVIPDYVLGSFAVSSLASLALVWKRGTSRDFWRSTTGLLVLLWFAAVIAGALSLGNEGGYRNVMMPFAGISAVLLPIAARELSTGVRITGFVFIVLLLQFGQFLFDPTGEKMLFAGSRQRAGAQEILQRIAALPGDVYIPYHGYVGPEAGKPAHAHILAAMDVMRMHDTTAQRLAREFDSAYMHRFSAVVLEESKAFNTPSVTHYHYGGTLLSTPNVGITRVADEATRPNYLWIRDTLLK